MAQLFLVREEKVEETYVRIAEDASAAWLYLVRKENGDNYTLTEVVDYLRKQGVNTGIDNDILIAMVKKGIYQREILVAEQIPSRPGKDGYYEFFFDASGEKKKPKLKEDGSIDYTSVNSVESVPADTKLARYHRAKKGIPGMNVLGYDLPLPAVRDLPELKGKGIKRDEKDNNLYLSAVEGKIDYQPGRLNIDNVHIIKGDVDQLIGKVEFYGDVVVRGNVDAGTYIRAGKSITVEGTVESAFLQAGGDIILKRGIQGNGKGKLICKGSCFADFIEQAVVEAGGDVEANAVMNSQINADGRIKLSGKHGVIMGGFVHGTAGIECTELGNDAYLPTAVHAGCPNKKFEEKKKLMVKEGTLNKDMERALADIRDLENYARATGGGGLDIDLKRRKLAVRKSEIELQMNEVKSELQKLSQYIYEMSRSSIKVNGNIYPGVSIRIGQSQYIINKPTSYTEYHEAGGSIDGEVFATG